MNVDPKYLSRFVLASILLLITVAVLADAGNNIYYNTIINATGFLRIPVGTTAQRPGTPVDGDMRVNSTTGNAEIYRNAAWRNLEGGGATPSGSDKQILTDDGASGIDSEASWEIDGQTLVSAGITWTARSAAEANAFYSVTYGNGLFVAVSYGGTNRVMTSPDGINWTVRTAAEANQWVAVTYGNGRFVAVSDSGTNRVMTSLDGITWTARSAAEANAWTSITYGKGLFVAVSAGGTNRVMTSPDGITWTARSAAEANAWESVTYGNNVFVAVAPSGTNQVMTSTDGITWTARAHAEANWWESVTYGNGLFVAVSDNGTNRVMTSPGGTTWTARSDDGNELAWQAVAYGNGVFAAVSNGGGVMTSPDGITWTSRTEAEANGWFGLVYGNGRFVATAINGTNRVMTSGIKLEHDELKWTNRRTEKLFTWGGAGLLANKPVAASFDGIAPTIEHTGTNLVIWPAAFDDTDDEVRGVTFEVPKDVAASGNVTFSTIWYSNSATTGNVIWAFVGSNMADGATWDTATTARTAAASAVKGTTKQITRTTWSVDVATLGWTAGKLVEGWVMRDGDHASDTMTGDARLIQFSISVPRS